MSELENKQETSPVVTQETVEASVEDFMSGKFDRSEPEADVDPEVLPEGSKLGEVYRVVRKIGEGGMGTVYEVEHTRIRKRYAAKVLNRAICGTREYVARLEREAIAATSIEHPNIVEVVNLDETEDGRVYLILELLSGEDLSSTVQRGQLPLTFTLPLLYQVADALSAAHQQGIIHRDLKPENLFLARRHGANTIKILDFGISKMDLEEDNNRLTKTGYVLGTPLYMSPEHAQGAAELDARADIYSLGVIAFELLTGQAPFSGRKSLEVIVKHLNEKPPTPSSVAPGLPSSLDKIVLKALEKNPETRYQTMSEVATAIQGVARKLGISVDTLPKLPENLASVRSESMLTPQPVALTSLSKRVTPGAPRPWLFPLAGLVMIAASAYVSLPEDPSYRAMRDVNFRSISARRDARKPVVPPQSKDAKAGTAEAPPEEVEVTIQTQPHGATVSWGERDLGKTPTTVSIPKSNDVAIFSVERNGFRPQDVSVIPNQAQSILVELSKKKKAARKASSSPGRKFLPTLRTRR